MNNKDAVREMGTERVEQLLIEDAMLEFQEFLFEFKEKYKGDQDNFLNYWVKHFRKSRVFKDWKTLTQEIDTRTWFERLFGHTRPLSNQVKDIFLDVARER